MKKMFFVTFIGLLFVFSVSAQNSVDSFSGSWKVVKHSFDTPIPNAIVTINIVQTGSDVKLEQIWKNNDTKAESNKTLLFKNNIQTRQIGGSPGKIEKSQIRLLNSKKFYINTITENNLNSRSEEIRETWSISDDGKFLTISRKMNSYNGSTFAGSGYYSETVYSKL
jgi:hypothetical protein